MDSAIGNIGNVADLVRRAAGKDSDHAALLLGDDQMSWGELDGLVDGAAAALRGSGLAPGDRLCLRLPNSFAFPIAYFGALRAGLVVVPVNPQYTEPELAFLLGDCGAAALVTDDDGLEVGRRLRDALPALDHVLSAGQLHDLATGSDGAAPAGSGRGGEDLAVLSYTSGTSGRPKGAMLSHRALLANLDQCGRMTQPPPVTPADVVLLVLPLFHIYGLNPGLGLVAWAGATGLLVPRFEPAETLALMARYRVTNVPGAPPMYVGWAGAGRDAVTAGFASVRLALSGAAPLPEDALRTFAGLGVTVHEGYGLTETSPVVTSTLLSTVRKPGSVGRALPDVDLELRDEQGSPVEDDDPGEVVVRGPNLFSGYWPSGHGGPDAQGWFPTGDVGYADDDGDLHLVDRRKELVLVSGFNVYPAEVEAVLADHPDVAEAAVIGVAHAHTGEAVRAYVVLRPGATLTEAQLLDHCARSLARFKCPSEVEFLPELPHSATGKVRKARLRELAGDPSSEPF